MEQNRGSVERLANVEAIQFAAESVAKLANSRSTARFDVRVVYERKVDKAAECDRLQKERKAALMGSFTFVAGWGIYVLSYIGALAIGAGVASIVLTLNVQLLLPVVGALYVTESVSVILQVGSFRMFGRRVFRMAPLQHHFELKGWAEVTIVIRFWIICGLCVAAGLGVFYAEWVAGV